jgi:hypothetical protein
VTDKPTGDCPQFYGVGIYQSQSGSMKARENSSEDEGKGYDVGKTIPVIH